MQLQLIMRNVLHSNSCRTVRLLSTSSSSSLITKDEVFHKLGLSTTDINLGCWNGSEWIGSGEEVVSRNPATGELLGKIKFGNASDYESCIKNMNEAQSEWMRLPAPKRGEIVRQIGMKLRDNKAALGALISMEMGKILSEGLGEVAEYIDMCDLAVGMSRQLPGQVLPSERQDHVLLETWNPLGKIGIITAFNFPSAVHGWNSAVSMIAGNTQIWKASPSTSLITIAQTKLMAQVLADNNIHGGVATMCQGGKLIGERMVQDDRVSLISFTGSTHVGRKVASDVASRFGKSILELGGNNAVVVMDDCDMDLAVRSVLFAAAGTAGQRCTTLRRLIVHEKIYDKFVSTLVNAYRHIKPGNPLVEGTLLGPLHTVDAVKQYTEGIAAIKSQGGKILYGGLVIDKKDLQPLGLEAGNYVWPTLVESNTSMPIVKEELFVPITHILKVKSFKEAVALNNDTPFGLSSSLFTRDMQKTFKWVGAGGSHCGIVNVNTSCSGAEIGGAFGGEKATGGGRESGSDAWKQYMRRSTCAINYGSDVPLAQGVSFSVN